MRPIHAALLLALSASPAVAQLGPVIVIPGRPDVPVFINGVDASWAVVEGEFGLARPGMVTPTVVYRPFAAQAPTYYDYERGYFPASGERPGYGRLEIVPPPDRPLPPPAPSFYRKWSSQSAPGPATEYAPYAVPPALVNTGRKGREEREGAPQGPGRGRK